MKNLTRLHPDDWRVIKADFDRRFPGRIRTRTPDGFPGKNLVTPDVLGYVTDADDTPVEVSTGVICGDRLYGLTWPMRDGVSDDRSRPVRSLDEVEAALDGAGR